MLNPVAGVGLYMGRLRPVAAHVKILPVKTRYAIRDSRHAADNVMILVA